ncbi:MAG TPA: hypothetical protein VNV39_01805 [Stellaceae bacterium]|jgi:hypothetical protein|nr:hypothetical protein [Stellaceae bacterium]
MAASFDTLRAARRLKEAGATDPVAEAIAETIGDARALDLSNLATKADLAEVELRLIKWVIGVGVAAFVALTGVIWTATQILLHAHF